MKKQGLYAGALSSIILAAVIAVSGTFIIKGDNEAVATYSETPDNPFVSYIKEPIVIEKIVEKEVVVYVEKEPEVIEEPVAAVAAVEEPIQSDIVTQPINTNFDILTPSNLSEEDIITALGDVRSGLHDIAPALVDAEQIYGVNALYLASKLGYESGWGKYETGYNNIAGWKGNKGSWSDFDSRYDCVMTVANGLATSFKEDVGSNIADVSWRYCKDPGYLDTLLSIMGTLQNNLF